jgi:NAD(P)-dependent dehydrogenase (short-subunit alcohol dehydrogenase family)
MPLTKIEGGIMLDIRDAVAVITGGAGGIGKALAQAWIANGGRVVLADVAPEPLQQTKEDTFGRGRPGRNRGVRHHG